MIRHLIDMEICVADLQAGLSNKITLISIDRLLKYEG